MTLEEIRFSGGSGQYMLKTGELVKFRELLETWTLKEPPTKVIYMYPNSFVEKEQAFHLKGLRLSGER